MADSATQTNSMLSADMARRLIARPIRRHVAATTPRSQQAPRPFDLPLERVRDRDEDRAPVIEQAEAPSSKRLEAEVRLMKAVIDAERRENASLRAVVTEDDEELGEEARAVRDRWMRVVDRLLQVSA